MSAPTPRPGVMDISAYVGGAAGVEGQTKAIKLSANEGAYGPSPDAIAATKKHAANIHRYPDGGAEILRDGLAECHDLPAERIVCGAGSDELISLLCQAYAGQGDEVLFPDHSFLMYAISAKAAGATPVSCPDKDLTTDVDSILTHVTDRTRIVFIANPNNPTGTYIPHSEVERLWKGLPENVLLVLDAAYAEFVLDEDYNAGEQIVDQAQNVVMTRTFSKLYSLGGLRLGWAYCSTSIADVLNRVRGPFNVNAVALAAGLAALKDTAHTTMVRTKTIETREWLAAELEKLGIECTKSVGNFVLMHVASLNNHSAADLDGHLISQGIIARRMDGYGLPDWLRVSIGTREEMDEFLIAVISFIRSNGPAS